MSKCWNCTNQTNRTNPYTAKCWNRTSKTNKTNSPWVLEPSLQTPTLSFKTPGELVWFAIFVKFHIFFNIWIGFICFICTASAFLYIGQYLSRSISRLLFTYLYVSLYLPMSRYISLYLFTFLYISLYLFTYPYIPLYVHIPPHICLEFSISPLYISPYCLCYSWPPASSFFHHMRVCVCVLVWGSPRHLIKTIVLSCFACLC